ncbi:hypothetical protein PKHYL_05270 [Psychrobacter sp. KH172YL61]|uniref:transporter substrate-binding domain-containing protein n=1 Tax=Psychrobacter sp. KH172YL61 TaxID=2517899 RepID=UPI0010AEFF52|nr:hypothetical protein PKHYL_05270 [Psychrobacter sp. KH172YL61]
MTIWLVTILRNNKYDTFNDITNDLINEQKALLLAPLSAAMLMLTGCNNSSAPAENAEADTASEAPMNIKIATESSYKPFSYTDADGKLIGYEIELVDALCAQMKAECEVISQDWDGLIPGLNAQKFDAAIAGMSITPERKEVVDFSDPYFHSGIILIGKKATISASIRSKVSQSLHSALPWPHSIYRTSTRMLISSYMILKTMPT